jgi:hypothetical protein
VLVLHAHSGFGNAAHDVHYAVVGAGVLGLVAILTPRLLAAPATPRDEHEARVEALRSTLAHSRSALLGLATDNQPNLSTTALDPHLLGSDDRWVRREPAPTAGQRVLLPLAVVSSAAAAGTHAAVLPPHLDESLLFGAFFAGSALLQMLWAAMVALRCSQGLLVAGAVGNLGVIGLWAITRTLGLPFGLLPGPEALGPWDVACGAWELVVVCSCIAILQSTTLPARLVGWRHWHPALPTYVAGSTLLLVALSLSGAGA